ncbi:MAG TPA: hypothetical protein VNB22_23345 [Pyrinomonadaceae bacterium]|jgi:hypothetical protein|nr:hypothetical protein [Pyrinomonadaceae bacterium]
MFPNEDCQFKVQERVYYVNFDELIEKTRNGNVLRHDPVKIGKSVWLDAEKIPELAKVFEENDLKNTLPKGVDFRNIFTNFQAGETNYKAINETEALPGKVCALHADQSPHYVCTVCENLFCRDCPAQNAEKKWICPFCGGNCVLYMGQIWQFENKKAEAKYEFEEEESAPKTLNYQVVYTKLSFRDFIDALIFPVRFPLALLVGGILFSVLVFGQIVTLFRGGGLLFVFAAITAVIMMLKFSILSKCFENLSQKERRGDSYMRNIKKFGVVEDFVMPFFTGLHSYFVAFGLFIILATAAGFYGWFSFTGNLETMETDVRQTEQHLDSVVNAGKFDPNSARRRESELKKMIDDLRLTRMESVFGTNHLADNKQLERLINSVMRLTLWFQMPICFLFIAGVLFFPAVCLSIGENHFLSIGKSFISGFKMMRIIGFDYVKILFMCFVLLLFSALNIYALSWLFSKIEMPVAGVFSAIVAGSFLIFYFWVAFSSILSTALSNKETTFEYIADDNQR